MDALIPRQTNVVLPVAAPRVIVVYPPKADGTVEQKPLTYDSVAASMADRLIRF